LRNAGVKPPLVPDSGVLERRKVFRIETRPAVESAAKSETVARRL